MMIHIQAIAWLGLLCSTAANIQDSDCDTVTDSSDCGRITKCEWDWLSNECYWRCNFLTSQATCGSKGGPPKPPKTRTRGCHWFDKPSAITGQRCQADCTTRTAKGFWDCIKSPLCMWTGKTCEISCTGLVKTECAIVKEQGFCEWKNNTKTEWCQQSCGHRPDRDTCDSTGNRETCEWDDCKRVCRDTTKVAQVDQKWKRIFQLESDCFERGVNSRWYWDYQCTGKASHCYIEDYKEKNAVWKTGNKCDYGEFDLKHCQPDCEALNKLALDPKYKDAEPTFDTSLKKAEHFCKVETASCAWNNGKCEWKKSCDIKWPSQIIKTKPAVQQDQMVELMRMDLCDMQTCTAARSGGGASPINLHGECADVKIVTEVGRLRRSRCFLKCELRSTQEQCMSQGEGGRLQSTYKGTACGPMKLAADGSIDANGKMQLPQECVSMCHWINNKCLTSCEMRATQGDCTGSCKWDNNDATGVKEYGGLPSLIPCSGTPSLPLYSANTVKANAATKVAGFSEKGGAGFVGPVSTCILAANIDGTANANTAANCYSSVELKLNTKYEQVYVPPSAQATTPAPSAQTCLQSPAKTLNVPKVKLTVTLSDGYTATPANDATIRGTAFLDAMKDGYAKSLTLLVSGNYASFAVTKSNIAFNNVQITGGKSTSPKPNEFQILTEVLINLPQAWRPSGVLDAIMGNSARQVDGVLIVGSTNGDNFLSFLVDKGFPLAKQKEFFGEEYWKWAFKATMLAAPTTTPAPTTTKVTTTAAAGKSGTTASGTTTAAGATTVAGTKAAGTTAAVTTTVTARQIVEIKSDLTMSVPDPDKFLEDPAAQTAVKEGIAAAHNVAADKVQITVEKATRRLLLDLVQERRLAGNVKIGYTIKVDADSSTTTLKSKAKSVTPAELTTAIQTKVTAAKGATYSVTVTKKTEPVIKQTAATTTTKRSKTSASWAARARSTSFTLLALFTCALRLF